jgi:glutamine synthetase
MADQLLMFKYIIKNVAKKYNKTVTFMPKPIFGDNGSGMHTHISLWKGSEPIFAGSGYAGAERDGDARARRHPEACSGDLGVQQSDHQQLQAVGAGLRGAGQSGLLAAQPLGGLPHPDVQPQSQGQADRVPLPRSQLQPVLAFSALLMAVIDGIQNKINPGDPLDKDIYDLPPEELALVPKTPGSLDEALDRLGEGSRVPVARRRVHGGRDRDVDQLQAGQRGGCDASAAASLRILLVLRHVIRLAGQDDTFRPRYTAFSFAA